MTTVTFTRMAKKGLNWQNNNSAKHHAFLYISLSSLHYYNVKMSNLTFVAKDVNTRQRLSFSFPKL